MNPGLPVSDRGPSRARRPTVLNRKKPTIPVAASPWRLLVLALAALAAAVPIPPAVIERYYSTLVYPPIQRALTGLSNLTAVALFDVLVVAALAVWGGLFLKDVCFTRGQTVLRSSVRVVLRTVTSAACWYLLFLATWGLNYRRLPLAEKLDFDAASVTPRGAADLAAMAVAEMNRLSPIAAEAGASSARVADLSLQQAFAETQRLFGASALARPARPKHTLLNWYFRRVAVDGMTDPYFLETLVLRELLPVEQPMVIAHEWAHLAGYADEGEANFVGWLTCLRASTPDRYSAWLFLYNETARGLPSAERSRIAAAIAAGPRRDLQAIAHRFQTQVNPALSAAGWQVYDRYLKANRVEHGTQSYADVVRLVLGTRLGSRLTPAAGSTRSRSGLTAPSG
jgi:hypothetical protein